MLATDTRTVTEYGVRLTWTDGHTETQAKDSRAGAELDVRMTNRRGDNPTAELVVRTVTITDWQVMS